MLQIQSKRFYLDVKQNKRGKFIKVTKNVNCHWISHFVRRLPRSALMAGEPRSSWLSPLQVGNDYQDWSKSWQCEQNQKILCLQLSSETSSLHSATSTPPWAHQTLVWIQIRKHNSPNPSRNEIQPQIQPYISNCEVKLMFTLTSRYRTWGWKVEVWNDDQGTLSKKNENFINMVLLNWYLSG